MTLLENIVYFYVMGTIIGDRARITNEHTCTINGQPILTYHVWRNYDNEFWIRAITNDKKEAAFNYWLSCEDDMDDWGLQEIVEDNMPTLPMCDGSEPLSLEGQFILQALDGDGMALDMIKDILKL